MCIVHIQSLTVNLISKKFLIISSGKQYFLLLLPRFLRHRIQRRWCRMKLLRYSGIDVVVVSQFIIPCSNWFCPDFYFFPTCLFISLSTLTWTCALKMCAHRTAIRTSEARKKCSATTSTTVAYSFIAMLLTVRAGRTQELPAPTYVAIVSVCRVKEANSLWSHNVSVFVDAKTEWKECALRKLRGDAYVFAWNTIWRYIDSTANSEKKKRIEEENIPITVVRRNCVAASAVSNGSTYFLNMQPRMSKLYKKLIFCWCGSFLGRLNACITTLLSSCIFVRKMPLQQQQQQQQLPPPTHTKIAKYSN